MKIKITNPDKIIYPKDIIKKIDIVQYYYDISEHMLKFIKNRPVSVIRCHQNIENDCFFKKHPTTEKDLTSSFQHDNQDFYCIKTANDILMHAQLGTIEFHNWASKINYVNKPDIMTFDLDPDESISTEKLADCVFKLKKELDNLGLKSFVKTSGGKGYHIIVPFKKSKNWESFNNFAKQITLLMESKYPKHFTSNIRKSERKGKIFVDYLRNSKGATCVAPYSLRARNGATISFPVYYKDVGKILPNQITINNYKKYFNKTKAWQNLFDTEQVLN